MTAQPIALKRRRACPICRRPEHTAFKPFCSRRCADADLARWLGEGYRIATDETPATRDHDDPDDGEPGRG
jgi:endogenous inhibitor of DNA gyrase (YacG/DUF329 family)